MPKRILFALCCTVLLWNVQGQQLEIDSLRSVLQNNDIKDSTRVNVLNQLAEAYFKVKADSVIPVAEQGKELAQRIGYLRGKYQAAHFIWVAHQRMGAIPKSFQAALELIDISKQLNDTSLIIESQTKLGSTYFWSHYHDKALEIFLQNLDRCEKANDKYQLGILLNLLGEVNFRGLGKLDAAEKYYTESKRVCRESENIHGVAVASTNLGGLYHERNDFQAALENFDEALRIERELNNPFFIAIILGSQGDVYFSMKNFKSADSLFSLAADYSNQLNAGANESVWLARRGKIAFEEKELSRSINLYQQALLKFPPNHVTSGYLTILSGISESYKMIGDLRNALLYKEKLLAAKDSLEKKEEKNKTMELEVRYQVEQHERKILNLENENAVKELELTQEAQSKKILIGGIVLLSFIVFFIIYNLIQKSKYLKTLSRQKKEIELQNARITHMNEVLELKTLRAQINPHFLFNALTSIQNFIRKNDQDNAIEYMQKFTRLVRRVLESSMVLSLTLREEMDMLKNYIELEQLRFNFSFDYKIKFTKDLEPEQVILPYLIVQPFVENAILHGLREKENGLLEIGFSKVEGNLVCLIKDNGIGREAAATRKVQQRKKSLGMSITKERIQKIGEFTSQKVVVEVVDEKDNGIATGTTVMITLPYEELVTIDL